MRAAVFVERELNRRLARQDHRPGNLGHFFEGRANAKGIDEKLIVVAAAMPSLVLLSRTRAYGTVRAGGAIFAGVASAGWIMERLLGVHNSVESIVNTVAHHAVWIAAGLFLFSLICTKLAGYGLGDAFLPEGARRAGTPRRKGVVGTR